MKRINFFARALETAVFGIGIYVVFGFLRDSPTLSILFAVSWFVLVDGVTKIATKRLSRNRRCEPSDRKRT